MPKAENTIQNKEKYIKQNRNENKKFKIGVAN